MTCTWAYVITRSEGFLNVINVWQPSLRTLYFFPLDAESPTDQKKQYTGTSRLLVKIVEMPGLFAERPELRLLLTRKQHIASQRFPFQMHELHGVCYPHCCCPLMVSSKLFVIDLGLFRDSPNLAIDIKLPDLVVGIHLYTLHATSVSSPMVGHGTCLYSTVFPACSPLLSDIDLVLRTGF